MAAGLPHHAVGQLGEERVGEVSDHQADGEGMARAEFARRGAGAVAEFIDDVQYLFALEWRDRAGLGVQHP
jgi:hypothetical protein